MLFLILSSPKSVNAIYPLCASIDILSANCYDEFIGTLINMRPYAARKQVSMQDYVLTCCSTADLSRDHLERRQIPYICFTFHMDGETYPDDLGQSISSQEFYTRIMEGALPTTSQPNPEDYAAVFEPYLQQGKDILHVCLSSGLSGALQSALIAQEELKAKYPARRIYVVDSLGASSGYGLLMDQAADLRDDGLSIDDLNNWLIATRLHVHHWFFSTDLTHFKRGGRISASSAVLGTLLNICPLLNVDKEGHLIQRKKIRGKKAVIREIVEKMEAHADKGLNYDGKCYISHSACYEDARQVADLIEARFPKLNGDVLINNIGAVIGSHTGPGTVALFFFGDERQD